MSKDANNDGYTHEAPHAAHIAIDMWDSHVAEPGEKSQFLRDCFASRPEQSGRFCFWGRL